MMRQVKMLKFHISVSVLNRLFFFCEGMAQNPRIIRIWFPVLISVSASAY